MRARCGHMNSPLVLNTRSTEAEVAGEQKTFSKSTCNTLNDPLFFRFFFTVHQCKTMVLDISHATATLGVHYFVLFTLRNKRLVSDY